MSSPVSPSPSPSRPRFAVPTASEVNGDRERLSSRRTLLFRPSSSSSSSSTSHNPEASASAAATAVRPPNHDREPLPPARVQQSPQQAEPGTPSAAVAVVPSPTVVASAGHAILVNKRQEGNPVLRHIRNVRWEWATIVSDFVVGQSACALFLSFKYHRLYPMYITERLRELKSDFQLRILICLVDVDDPGKTLSEINVMCVLMRLTLVLAWSNEEAGRYLETFKLYENRPADAIKGRVNADFISVMTEVLTTVKSVNKTDVVTLLTHFGSLENIMNASKDELALCPGFGEQKAKRLHDAFREPFIVDKRRRMEQRQPVTTTGANPPAFGPTTLQD